MLTYMRKWVLILGLLSSAAEAEMYKWVDPEGNVIYSDQPRPGAEKIQKLEVQTYPAPRLPERLTAPRKAEPQAPVAVGYKSVEIVSPPPDETIWDNSGNIPVRASLAPMLQVALGHRVLLLMDGQKASEPGTSVQFELSNIERGTHSLQVVVIDGSGKQLAASSVSNVHLKQHACGAAGSLCAKGGKASR